MNKTSLYEKHKLLGAKIVDFAGWQMPIQYTSVKEEVQAVRTNVGVFDVSHMGEFFITGKQTYDFLDYLLPNDIKNAPMGKAIYSPLCREDGTIIDDLIVYKLAEEEALVCVNASNIDKDFKWFSDQIKSFDCKLQNKSNEYSLLAIQGPNAEQVLKQYGLTPKEIPGNYYECRKNNDTIIARTGYTGEDGFEIFSNHKIINDLWVNLIELGVTPCGLAARDVLRLEVCFPLYGHELNDEVTPLDCGLKWTVKLNKLDFIGKQSLQNHKPQFQLVKLTLDRGVPREGYVVLNSQGENIGIVTSGTMSVSINKGIALARISVNKYPADEGFNIQIRNQTYTAIKQVKPFITGSHK